MEQDSIRHVYNPLKAHGIRTLQTGKTESVLKYWSDTQMRDDRDRVCSAIQAALDMEESELVLKKIWSMCACKACWRRVRRFFMNWHIAICASMTTSRGLEGLECRIYTKEDKDNDAFIPHIVGTGTNRRRSSYSTILIDMVVAEIKPVEPPAVSGPGTRGASAANDILNANGPYIVAVLAAYDNAVKTTVGKTQTQLGLAADRVSCR